MCRIFRFVDESSNDRIRFRALCTLLWYPGVRCMYRLASVRCVLSSCQIYCFYAGKILTQKDIAGVTVECVLWTLLQRLQRSDLPRISEDTLRLSCMVLVQWSLPHLLSLLAIFVVFDVLWEFILFLLGKPGPETLATVHKGLQHRLKALLSGSAVFGQRCCLER